jgi:hypothetical protein
MSIQKMAEVWKLSKNGGSLLLVELAIADHINGAGIAWPSIKHLAKKTKLSERQVQRVVKKLEQTGELIILRDRRYHRYKITLDDKLSDIDKLSGIEDDIQGIEYDIQGTKGDTQGTKGDTAESIKSLLTINETINKSVTSLQISEKDPALIIWEKLLAAVKFEKSNVLIQLSNYHDVSFENDTLTVWVTDIFQADYLNDRAVKTVEHLLVGILARSIKVKFAIKEHEYSNI